MDLPLTLTRVIIEMRSDIIYANALLPVDDLSVELDDLTAVYNSPEDQTGQAAKIQLAARTIARPKIKLSALPNPIKALADSGVGAPAAIEKIYAPEVMASGDQVFVKIQPVAGAKNTRSMSPPIPTAPARKPRPPSPTKTRRSSSSAASSPPSPCTSSRPTPTPRARNPSPPRPQDRAEG